MNKFYNFLAFLLLIIAIICAVFNKEISNKIANINNPQEELQQAQVIPPQTAKQAEVGYTPEYTGAEVIEIPVNRPTPLSGKTKAEVYKIRKAYVEKSIFKNLNYEPSEDVFGQITDRKPWIANYICHKNSDDPLPTKGESEEARFINNPTVLLGLEYPFWFHSVTDYTFCDTDLSTLMPQLITYNGAKKEITVEYQHLPFATNNDNTFYQFNGVNARDLGYKYVYFDKSKSTYDIEFSRPSNISTDVYELYNFIHLGYACGVNGGCNNGSPRQEFLEFKNNNYRSEIGKVIYLKLWKTRPQSPKQEADITEKIIFRE